LGSTLAQVRTALSSAGLPLNAPRSSRDSGLAVPDPA